jgi:hypothetical protein
MRKVYKIILLSLIFSCPLNLNSHNIDINPDSLNINEKIKLIDENIVLIRNHQSFHNDSFLLLAKHTLSLAQKYNYQRGINQSCFYVAKIYDLRNKMDSATKYYKQGLENEIPDVYLYADYLWNLAEVYRKTGNLSSSLENGLKVKALVESNQIKRYSYSVYNLLALSYRGIMQYDLAFENYLKSAKLAVLEDNEAFAGVIYSNIGQLLYDQNKFKEALIYLEKGSKLEEKYELYAVFGNSLNIIADIYLQLNNLDSTKLYLEKALLNNNKSKNYWGLATTFYGYGKIHIKENNIDSAIYYINQSVKLAQSLNYNSVLKDAYLTLSEVYSNKKDFEKAYYYHDLFFETHNKIYNVEKINKSKSIEYRLLQQENENEIVELKLKKQKTINILLIAIFSLVVLAGIIIIIYLIIFKKLNKELVQSKEKSEESDILKSEFLKTISHEIRTPLNGIIGFTDMIIAKDHSPNELKEIQEYLFKNSQELTSTIENIVDMAHLSSKQYHVRQTATKVSVLFEKVIAQVKDGFLYDHKKDIIVDLDLEYDIEFYTDKNILRKIILQLVKNAIKYTEEGKITIGCYKEKSNIIFYIKDPGIGIPKEKIDVIFSPFRQVGENTNIKNGGVGLGLTITKEFVSMLNGKIWVDSEFKKGSTFFVSLPN